MGSDSPPSHLFEAVLLAVDHFDVSVSFVVFATQEVIDRLSKPQGNNRIKYHLFPNSYSMGDEPLKRYRHKKDSSLLVGIRLLKKRQSRPLFMREIPGH